MGSRDGRVGNAPPPTVKSPVRILGEDFEDFTCLFVPRSSQNKILTPPRKILTAQFRHI